MKEKNNLVVDVLYTSAFFAVIYAVVYTIGGM